ncbi:hypothetical protein ES676_01750 [Bizionia saleffrena]|uniref:Tetratricopeptide repeat protein n=1 Tax=Bizionia saleffrena TaxID=291189 RepID=A0A8H2LGW1_9FLAO|nr:tetratricopeptide repeat protein [Bizionia saleffrena]TYB77967.1 hypothetical protein ES676_01750 [Bizionia saleffrena]
MNTSEFTYLLQHPTQVNASQTEALKTIINTFPYFQSARALYLKGLKNVESFKYNHVLKATAAYTTDRSILFDFITSETFEQNKTSEFIKHHKLDSSDLFVTTDAAAAAKAISAKGFSEGDFQQEITNTTNTLDANFFQPKTADNEKGDTEKPKIIESESNDTTRNDTPREEGGDAVIRKTSVTEETATTVTENVLNIGQPLQFNKNETHSFNEWLSLSKFKPIEREITKKTIENRPKKAKKTPLFLNKNAETSDALDKAKKFDLIEQFIAKKPKLKAPTAGSSHQNIAQAQMIQPEALMTETLARIYVEQGNFKKAIQSYNILILKYPEKSGFFADQIKAIKQLQEQNNKQ